MIIIIIIMTGYVLPAFLAVYVFFFFFSRPFFALSFAFAFAFLPVCLPVKYFKK